MLQSILLLLAGLVVLIGCGEFLVRGASCIALKARISPMVVGLTIVAFGTSAPELIISIQAALKGSPDIATGNVIGSNICNLSLILGVTALIRPVLVQRATLVIDWPVAFGSVLLFWLFSIDQQLVWWEGIIFIILLCIYVVYSIRSSRKKTLIEQSGELPTAHSKTAWKDPLFIVLGGIGLYFGSEWFVGGAKIIAMNLGIEERIIGLTVVAVGTSLPELVASGVSAFRSHTDMAIGNLMGSNIFNILSIMGITSIVTTVSISDLILTNDFTWMAGITVFVLPLMIIKKDVSRMDGLLLLLFYAIYVMVVFW
ncbi:MAG: calcium/sodium antiporter [Cyclobacteriaceae bacterium]